MLIRLSSLVITLLALPSISFAVPALSPNLNRRASKESTPTGLNSTQITDVKARLRQAANASWELGVETEALLELEWPTLSVFGSRPFPFPSNISGTKTNASDVIEIVEQVMSIRPPNSPTLMTDSAVGDPASLGYAFLLAASQPNGTSYADAASDELNYLLNTAPKTPDGAISHRSDQVQLWADFIYMAPPFLASSAALSDPASKYLLLYSYTQISLYRKYLSVNSTSLLNHIVLGNFQDLTLWATGNAWAAAGMLRVSESIKKSILWKGGKDKDLSKCVDDLEAWAGAIVGDAWSYQLPSGALLNTLNATPNTSFPDSSSTAFFSAISFRLASISSTYSHYTSNALKAMQYVKSQIDPLTGWLHGVVNPIDFTTTGPDVQSPEGQAFVLLMHAAWRDWKAGGTEG